MSVSVTIRKARESDRRFYDWQAYFIDGNGPFKPWVLTVDGIVYLVMQDEHTIVYQSGSEAIPALAKMMRRYFESLQSLYEDRDSRKEAKIDESLAAMARMRAARMRAK